MTDTKIESSDDENFDPDHPFQKKQRKEAEKEKRISKGEEG